VEEWLEKRINDKTFKLGKTLDSETQDQIAMVISRHLNAFAWSASDMPGIDPDFLCHRLAMDPQVRPIRQRRRKFNEEKRQAIKDKTQKLLAAGHIREIQYPEWLANVVLVKKSSGKWRMCVDFTNLNKASPKDSYPFPSIDALVDSASGCKLLSFLDAFSGYNQIKMHPMDEEKTAFKTERSCYFYKVMPFGLKNAEATYQRLMDKVLAPMLGRNVQAYVDDMVVTSLEKSRHVADLEELFVTITKYKLKLNPEKCIFRVEAGKFLGFLLSERGIEANPDKCAAILAMRSPATVKKVQQLTGRMVALSRFVSASGEKGHPYFQCLNWNNRFVWTKECEEAFAKLKEYLASPPVLCKPQAATPLRLYFAITDRAISVMLVQDQDQVQKPIYFVSKVLQGPEVRYQALEKAALAVVFSARRLRHYFQSFTVLVMTDLPIQKVLKKPDVAGRMVKWAVELSEFNIKYEPRGPIKGQIFADFVVELSSERVQNPGDDFRWVLSGDGSSNQLGSGAGVILEGPNGVLIEQSLRFAFKASNNQAEYEALIAGILLAKEMGAKVLMAKSDSLLATGQVTGDFQAKDPAGVTKMTQVCAIHEPDTWITPYQRYMADGVRPMDSTKARKIKKNSSKFTLIDGELYRFGFTHPLLVCVHREKCVRIMAKLHEGICGSHIGGRALATRTLRAGYYWPTTREDCKRYAQRCKQCQQHADWHKAPQRS